MRGLVVLLAVMWFGLTARADEPAPIEVMVVGGFHMANPGHDLHNVQVPDMLLPKYQAEIEAVDAALSRFRPTAVAAEWSQETVAERYTKYQAGSLPPSRNEVVQLAFRLAMTNNARMAGIDVDGDFPYDAVETYAKAHGQQRLLESQGQAVQAMVVALTRMINEHGVERLRAMIDASGKAIELEVDGGVTPDNARACVDAGATALVAGTAVFRGGASHYAANIAALKQAGALGAAPLR